MKKFIELMNDDRVGGTVFGISIVAVIMAMMIFSCLRDEAGLVSHQAPLELTECSTCSP